MAKRTIFEYTCDGLKNLSLRCGKVLTKADDGLIIHGTVRVVGNESLAVGDTFTDEEQRGLGYNESDTETALCWECWHRRIRDPLYLAARDKPPTVEYRVETDRDEWRGPGAGLGPGGPLSPPELLSK